MTGEDFQKGDLDGSSGLGILDKIRLELDKDKEKWDDFCRELVRGLNIQEHILEAAEQGNKEAWIKLPSYWRVRDSYDKGSKRSNKLTDYQISELNIQKDLIKGFLGKIIPLTEDHKIEGTI